MNNNSAQKIIDSIKQILSIYKIDFDPTFEAALDSDSEENYQYLIEKTQEKIQELDRRSQEILLQTGMTKEQMEIFSSNPDNFSNEEWQALEKIRSSCEAYKKETEALINEVSFELGGENLLSSQTYTSSANKKNKKKNWIPL